MTGRPFAIAAVVGIWIAAPVTAEPGAKPVKANAPAEERAPAMLAAADVKLQASVKAGEPSDPAKPKRNARVTTCRCADVSAPQN
jgi:capsular polysaccharide biosynthesis protein